MGKQPIQPDLFGGMVDEFFERASRDEPGLTPGERTKIRNAGFNMTCSRFGFEGLDLRTVSQLTAIICRPHLIRLPDSRPTTRPATPEKNMHRLMQVLGMGGVGEKTSNLMVTLLRKHNMLEQPKR